MGQACDIAIRLTCWSGTYRIRSHMPRRPRAEVEGGLYHLIARGNNRQVIFHDTEDFKKFLSLLSTQKAKLGFYIYAYCLMSNHFHLLIERQAVPVGRIMLRVLTGYSQYYNRKYRKVGHVFQGRHKAILCQADRYLGELVRYIHLNPVRAKMVRKAERYAWSSQRAYLGMEPETFVDADPVLRLFGARKAKARENFVQFVAAGAKLGHMDEYYSAGNEGILGSEEFVDAAIHRIWERDDKKPKQTRISDKIQFDGDRLVRAVESVLETERESFCGPGKSAVAVYAKEVLILAGVRAGALVKELSELTGVDPSTVSRRHDRARLRSKHDAVLREHSEQAFELYVSGDK
jgi:putative transposase